jgi:hypothetical protein
MQWKFGTVSLPASHAIFMPKTSHESPSTEVQRPPCNIRTTSCQAMGFAQNQVTVYDSPKIRREMWSAARTVRREWTEPLILTDSTPLGDLRLSAQISKINLFVPGKSNQAWPATPAGDHSGIPPMAFSLVTYPCILFQASAASKHQSLNLVRSQRYSLCCSSPL